MHATKRIEIDQAFTLNLPAGWQTEPDEEGGINLFSATGSGLLHLVAFPQPPGEMLDPADELYAFLEEQGIELKEDEVEDLELGDEAELALCEYLTEEEEDEEEESTFWLVGVATAPGNLVFGNYSCPAGEEAAEREIVREILASLRLNENP